MVCQIYQALSMLIVMTFCLGFLYPLAITGIAQIAFPAQANGSIVYLEGKPVGSRLIGQDFSSPGYFHSRPSAAGEKGYDAAGSGGSNLGPTNSKLIESVTERLKQIREENGLAESAIIPADLVLASGSGLDPDISGDAAYLQTARIAKERNITLEQVRMLISRQVEDRQLGLFGEPRINVLQLNLALDSLVGKNR